MTPYHGTPLGCPKPTAADILAGRHAFVSMADTCQLDVVMEVAQSFACDNGAFGAWRAGRPIADWAPFYEWAGAMRLVPACDFAVIPDVVDGGEPDNDALIREWPHGPFGAPVWHLDESLDRLARLAADWPRLCLGSSGEYAEIGTPGWWRRIAQAMEVLCDADGRPRVKLHGLRMLDVRVFSRIPFASADSTNVARNIGIDSRWSGAYSPPDKAWRGKVIAARIEAVQAPARWTGSPQTEFSLEVA